MSEAEEYGYEGTYFGGNSSEPFSPTDGYGYIPSSPPKQRLRRRASDPTHHLQHNESEPDMGADDTVDVIFFQYGVVVFYGLDEDQERGILEDMENAGKSLDSHTFIRGCFTE
jgi:uncharacterized Rmd1/YagE family protein